MSFPVSSRTVYGEVTIANGASLSAGFNLAGRTLAGVKMAAGWTAASLTFQVSLDGGLTYGDLYGYDVSNVVGEVTREVAAANAYALEPFLFSFATHIKLRSGTSGAPVNQGAERVIQVGLREYS